MTEQERLLAFEAWLSGLPVVKRNAGPANGTLAGALVLLERLKKAYVLDLKSHLTPKGAQVKGAGGPALRKLLSKLGEHRPFSSEGGRTNRGLVDSIGALLVCLRNMDLDECSPILRIGALSTMQEKLLVAIRAFHNRQRLKLTFNATRTTLHHVSELLKEARLVGKDGPVAQHLVGAKLQVRFPAVAIGNESFTTADAQLGRAGDFVVGDTAFHVTVAPMPHLFDRCRANLDAGLNAYVLVPARKLEGARQLAGEELLARVAVCALEMFVAQNVDELGQFRATARAEDFARLLRTYNDRVAAVEPDRSLLIELPANLPRAE